MEGYNCLLWSNFNENLKGSFDRSGYHIDHKVEFSISHDDSFDNLQALCLGCHGMKTKSFAIYQNKDCVINLHDGEDTIIKGIKCRDCLQNLPPMTVRQYLSGDFNKKCCPDKRDKIIIDTTITRVEELRVKYNTLAKNYIITGQKYEYLRGYYAGFQQACELVLAYLQNDPEKEGSSINDAERQYKIMHKLMSQAYT